jgi:pilus assembly protein Flp/PilA
MTLLRKFYNDESGATAIEYGLIAAIIAVGLIGALSSLKSNLAATFNKVSNAVNTAN